MWLLSFVPETYIYLAILAALISGVVLYVLAVIGSFFRTFEPYTGLVKVVSVLIIIISTYLFGGYGIEMEWRHKVDDLQAQIKAAEDKSKQVNTKIVTRIKTKVKVIKEYKTVYKTQLKEVAAKIDKDCKVDPEAIKIINNSASQSKGNK